MFWKNLLKIFPLEAVIKYILDFAETEANKTPSLVDDKIVEAIRALLAIVLSKKNSK